MNVIRVGWEGVAGERFVKGPVRAYRPPVIRRVTGMTEAAPRR